MNWTRESNKERKRWRTGCWELSEEDKINSTTVDISENVAYTGFFHSMNFERPFLKIDRRGNCLCGRTTPKKLRKPSTPNKGVTGNFRRGITKEERRVYIFFFTFIFFIFLRKRRLGGEPLQNSNLATADEVDTLLLRSSLDVEVDEEADDRLPVDDELDGKDSFNRFMDGAFRLMGRLRLVRKSVTTRERGRN